MDDSYRHNGIATPAGTHSQSLAPHSNLQTSHYSNSSGSSHTLPPLHSGSQYPPVYGQSGGNTHTPLPAHLASSSSAPPNLTASAPSYHSLRPIQPIQQSYQSPNMSYPPGQHSVIPTTTGYMNSQGITSTTAGGPSQDIRPMPQGGMGLPQQYGQSQVYQQPPTLPNQEPEPVHVVGQQGRRGVLPTLSGRPPPAIGKQPTNPTKNADNKFECPHCTKTYLHLKHLKRHLLRHTGERPYQCHLCKDTFSRSDILKRHFQKCSIRRGNPTGANHLAHSQSHLRKNRLSNVNANEQSLMNSINTSAPYTDPAPFVNSLPGSALSSDHSASHYSDNIASLSARSSRSNSLIRNANNPSDGRRGAPGMDYQNANRGGYEGSQPYRPASTLANSIPGGSAYSQPVQPTAQMQAPYGYQPPTSGADLQNSIGAKSEGSNPMYGRPGLSNLDNIPNGQSPDMQWHGTFNSGGHPSYQFPHMGAGPGAVKNDSDPADNQFQSGDGSNDGMFSKQNGITNGFLLS